MKGVSLGRFAGPFKNISFDSYIESPLELVPKANSDVRLFFHLSYPRSKDKKLSVNAYMSKEL